MDANGTRFHLLQTRRDWRRCTLDDGRPLAEAWPEFESESGSPPPGAPPPIRYSDTRGELTLAPKSYRFVPEAPSALVDLDARRGAAVDRFGNVYWIDADRQRVLVRSIGNGRHSVFWQGGEVSTAKDEPCGAFHEQAPAPPRPLRLAGLAVTIDHYLVAGVDEAPGGLLIFDLFGGSQPLRLGWPRQAPIAPFEIAARPAGGVVILDRERCCVWRLAQDFVVECPSAETDPPTRMAFQPVPGGETRFEPATAGPRAFPLADSPSDIDPVGIVVLPDDSLLILDRDGDDGFARVLRVRGSARLGIRSSRSVLNVIEENEREGFSLVAHAMAFVVPAATVQPSSKEFRGRLLVVPREGNQAVAFALEASGDRWSLAPEPAYLPMRLFGGIGVPVGPSGALYDAADVWVPLVEQPIPRYARHARILTWALDSATPDCVWHRIVFDGCVPPGTSVTIESRTADEIEALELARWSAEPRALLRRDGAELPWLPHGSRGEQEQSLRRGSGSWELLLQQARGRYLQLRIAFTGNERATPRLRALRVWYPRFSYLHAYLPAVYRDDPSSASFLDRMLANFEGFYTVIEDRVTHASALFDPRTTPADALEWLGAWLGLVFDPSFPATRRRLLIQHAMHLYQFRGTVHGLRLALRLALDESVCDATFALAADLGDPPRGIRISERFLQRRLARAAASDLWSPADGGAELVRRYAQWLVERGEDAADEFPLVPDAKQVLLWEGFCDVALACRPWCGQAERSAWNEFARKRHHDNEAELTAAWGTGARFGELPVPRSRPSAPARIADWLAYLAWSGDQAVGRERARWHDFLVRRYGRVKALQPAHSADWQAFDEVPLPDRLPADGAALTDWFQYESTVRSIAAAAHRFTVLLPVAARNYDPVRDGERRRIAERVIALEKPAQATFDVRMCWAALRVGEARLGADTMVDLGSRSPWLAPPIVLGRDFVGAGRVAASPGEAPRGRGLRLGCAPEICVESTSEEL